MRLLVSVATASEVSAAIEGGADVIDAKDPASGALGAVVPAVLSEIHAAVGGRRMVTAALGDAVDAAAIELAAHEFAERGADLVKVGFAGIDDPQRVAALIASAVRGCARARRGRSGVVAVAYADVGEPDAMGAMPLVELAARHGARGVLIDTADKSRGGLLAWLSPDALSAWVAHAHGHGLIAALAGRLVAEDLPILCDAGADIAGVRGAACEGGRDGHVSAARIGALRQRMSSWSIRSAGMSVNAT